jgi:hypothetical protein
VVAFYPLQNHFVHSLAQRQKAGLEQSVEGSAAECIFNYTQNTSAHFKSEQEIQLTHCSVCVPTSRLALNNAQPFTQQHNMYGNCKVHAPTRFY